MTQCRQALAHGRDALRLEVGQDNTGALVAAREPHTIERASKVLRDRVAFALQKGGVSEPWLEQWWLWPSIAPTPED